MLANKQALNKSFVLQENATMAQENMRLSKAVANGVGGADRDVLQEIINSNERLLVEKQKVQVLRGD